MFPVKRLWLLNPAPGVPHFVFRCLRKIFGAQKKRPEGLF